MLVFDKKKGERKQEKRKPEEGKEKMGMKNSMP
jgi:hypothetical protein